MEYILVKMSPKSWQCRVNGQKAVGWGSRPDLAIRNWHEQERLWRQK
jgi:hypothetical protein